MRLIDADLLIADILESRRSETETVPKLIRMIQAQPPASALFVCDGRACEGDCDGCSHTSDVTHATNFSRFGNLFFEEMKAEPKTGHWIVVDEELNDCDGHRTFHWYECDNCGARPPKNQWGHEWHSNYCPNCGAKMEEEE